MRKSALVQDEKTATGLRDLESVQKLMTSHLLMAIFDIPWTPFFLVGSMIFNPWLGYLGIAGGAVLIAVAIFNPVSSRQPLAKANQAVFQAESISSHIRAEAEMIRALGMTDASFDRWQMARGEALKQQLKSNNLSGGFTASTTTLRMLLQSAMLGLGAYLVLQNELSAGAMIAGSILPGHALAPVELAIGQ